MLPALMRSRLGCSVSQAKDSAWTSRPGDSWATLMGCSRLSVNMGQAQYSNTQSVYQVHNWLLVDAHSSNTNFTLGV